MNSEFLSKRLSGGEYSKSKRQSKRTERNSQNSIFITPTAKLVVFWIFDVLSLSFRSVRWAGASSLPLLPAATLSFTDVEAHAVECDVLEMSVREGNEAQDVYIPLSVWWTPGARETPSWNIHEIVHHNIPLGQSVHRDRGP